MRLSLDSVMHGTWRRGVSREASGCQGWVLTRQGPAFGNKSLTEVLRELHCKRDRYWFGFIIGWSAHGRAFATVILDYYTLEKLIVMISRCILVHIHNGKKDRRDSAVETGLPLPSLRFHEHSV